MLGARGAGYRLVRFAARCAMAPLHRQRVRGLENVPREGGALLVANHQSMLDIPFIGTTFRRRVTFVARDTLTKNAFLAWVIHTCAGITVRRGTADRTAIDAMVAALEAGELVAIFPEGTRSPDGSVGPFQRGALLVARRARVPVLPVGVAGTGEAWPRGRALPRPGRLGMCVGAPIDGSGTDGADRAHAEVCRLADDADRLRGGSGLPRRAPREPANADPSEPATGSDAAVDRG